MLAKVYQTRAVDRLQQWLLEARTAGLATAFSNLTRRQYVTAGLPPVLQSVPYVCFRVPTGGGKTLMAAMLLQPVLRTHLGQDRAVVLWFTPTTAIRDQTLARLREPTHPYRVALERAVGAQVDVRSIDEAYLLTPADLSAQTTVIVATLQALRQEETEGRRAYADSGNLMPHFQTLPPSVVAELLRREDGSVVRCLVNMLAVRRPIIICDEAHNARTPLSLDVFARLRPSAILELTATPALRHEPARGLFASNVLERVSAAELHQDQMIKLPIELRTRSRWEDALAEGLERRDQLEQLSREAGIRPILLVQAERKREGGALTPEVVRDAILTRRPDLAGQVVIRTGTRDELGETNLMDPACAIRVIITQQALREGWDCAWAYVLCSLQNSASATAVEQILGRILRQPGAQWLPHPALNRSYAYVVSEDFGRTARALTDALVEQGFERTEAELQVIQPESDALPLFNLTTVSVTEPPNLDAVPAEVAARVTYDDVSGTLTVEGALTDEERGQLAGCFPSSTVRAAVYDALTVAGAPHPRAGPPLPATGPTARRVPWLSVRGAAGQLEVLTGEHFLREGVRLSQYAAALDDVAFPAVALQGEDGEISINAQGRLQAMRLDATTQQLALLDFTESWTADGLVRWLDRKLQYDDVPSQEKVAFLALAMDHLLGPRAMSIQQLGRDRHRLLEALEKLIAQHRDAAARQAYQATLFGPGAPALAVSEAHALVLDPTKYAYDDAYSGALQFRKHLFPIIGELESSGEEFECACRIDRHENVAQWVRNTDGRPRSSFWLQLPTARFYPDFLVWTRGGRLLVVEYKGTHLYTSADAAMKRRIGKLWETVAEHRVRFLMLNGPDWSTLDAFLSAPPDRAG